MSDMIHTTIESFSSLPNMPEQPSDVLAAAASMAVVAAGAYYARHYHANTNPKGAVDARGNQNQLRGSLIGTAADTDKMLFSPVRQIAIGLGIAALQLAQPTYDATYPDAKAEVVVIADSSSSMFAKDLGEPGVTRYAAAIQGLKESEFQGSLGIIQTAAETELITKPIVGWRPQAASIDQPRVNPNGGEIGPALDLAASLFTEDPETKLRSGTIVMLSDGTVNKSREQLQTQADKLKKMGIIVRVVVPGTSEGTYVLPKSTQKVKAGIQPDNFAAFGDNVTQADTVEEVREAVSKDIKTAGTRRERKNWPVPLILGSAIGLLGVGRLVKRNITKY